MRANLHGQTQYQSPRRAETEKADAVSGLALEAPYQDHPATAYSFAALPVRMALERHDWAAAAELGTQWPTEIQWEKYPYVAAIPQFAVALASRETSPRARRTPFGAQCVATGGTALELSRAGVSPQAASCGSSESLITD